jgi:glycine/serine hydroxymethyltransferase
MGSSDRRHVRAALRVHPPQTNKYSEGYPGARYYGGNEFIDMAERCVAAA